MFKGKALLVIDRLHCDRPGGFYWDIQPYIQSLNQDDPGGEVEEAFSCMAYNCLTAPNAAYKMQVGDRIRVQVSFEIHFHQSWEGEWDMDMYLTTQKVLRRQPYNFRQYRKKFYRFWKMDQNDKVTS